jgi:gliding motility-associated-like protein
LISIRLHTVFLPLALILCSVSIKAQLTWEFVNELSDGNVIEVNAVEADTSRSCVYIAGTFNSDLSANFSFGLNGTPDFSVNNGGTDGFVAKYLEDGTLVWAFMIGGAGSDIINDLDIDPSGNIYITGSFNTAAEFRGTEATSFSNASSFGGDDIFYAKYDVDGKFQWLHEDGGASDDVGVKLEIVNSSIVVAGEYESAGLTEIAGATPVSYGGVDVCLVGLDLNGVVLWNADGGSDGNDGAGGLAGEGDSIYIGVNFTGSNMTYTDFGLNTTAAQINTFLGSSDISVCSFGASSGLYGWTEQVRGGSDAFCHDMIANSADLILCGSYNLGITFPTLGFGPLTMLLSYDAIIWSMDNDNGACSWYCAEQTTGGTDARATCLEFDQAGNIVIGGEFNGQLNIRATYTMNSNAGNNLFTVGYTSSGAYLFHDSASTIGVIDVNDLTINGVNDIYYVGSTNSNVVFTPLSTTLSGGVDGFFAKLSNCDAAFSYSSASFCSGNLNVLPAVSGDPGGAFSESTGNIIFVDPATGEIDLTASVVGGPYNVTYTAPAGCQETQAITILSNSAPVFSFCPSSITAINNTGSCDTTIVYALPTATDDCGTVTILQTDLTGYTTGDNFPVGTTNQEYTATDEAGNTAICTFTVDVIDNEAPTFTLCPNNISQGNTIGTCGASVSFSSPIVTDNCLVTFSQISGLASGATFPIDTTINTFVAMDNFGTDTCSFIVVVEDVEAPSITCPSDIIQPNDAGQCSAIVNYTVPTGTDNCFVDSTWISLGDSSGASFPVGPPITVEYFVQDIAGLQSSCAFTITVVDTANPTVLCPSDTTLYTDVSSCEVLFNYSVPIGDNCGSPVLNQDAGLPSSSLFPQGATVNTFSVVDASLNTATCSFLVTVVDTIAPVAVCFSDTTLTNDPDSCGAIFTYAWPNVTDNCDTVFSISQIDTSGLFPGDLFPIGTTEIIFTVEDNSSNVDTCNFFVTVIDVDPPTISNCPLDTVLNNDSSLCGAVFVYSIPTAMDNCGSVLTPVQIDTTGYMSNDLFPVGTTQLVYAVTDSAGNSDTCSFIITVNDVETPVLSCPTDTIIFNNADSCGAFFTYLPPMANDNCDTSLTIVQIDTTGYVSGNLFPVGSTEIVYAVADMAGNSDTCSFTITVVDTAAPMISCLSDTSIFNDPDSCGAIFNYAMPTAYDNCDVLFDTIKIDTSGYSSGDLFPIGTTEISYVYRDLSGNADTCSFLVTVVDNQKPELVCHADTSMQNDSGICGAVFSYSFPTASDNCLVDTIFQIAGLPSDSIYPVDTIVNTFVAIDIYGNTDTCSFEVGVRDGQLPTFSLAYADSILFADSGSCFRTVYYNMPFYDNCPGAYLIASDSSGSEINVTGPIASDTIYFTVFDAAGWNSPGHRTYRIIDAETPIVTCQSNDTIYSSATTCEAEYLYEAPNVSDNCGVHPDSIYTLGTTPPSPAFFPVGNNFIDWKVVDFWGNSSTCSQTITVLDTIAPELFCPSDTVLCDSVYHYPLPVYSDSCGIRSLTTSIGSLILPNDSTYTFPVDTTILKYTVLDLDSNLSSCSFNIVVLPPIFPFWDTLPPIVCLKADTIDLRALASPTPGWFSGSGVLGQRDFLAQVAGVGVHDITFTVENVACSKDSTYPIEVLPNPVIDAGQDDSICGLIYALEGSSSMVGYWYSDSMMVDVQSDVGSSCSAPNYSTYELVWQITGPPTCEASDSVSVTFDEQINAYAGPDQYILEDLETAFEADSLVLGEGYWDILLGTGEIVDIADPNSTFFPSTYGVYELEWVVQNGSCPPVIDDLLLEFRRIAIPEGLSPNWDGLNDEFIVPGISQFAYKEIKIYDRWGKLVYQDEDYNNDWRGTNLNDERLIDDTYFYEVTLDTYTVTGFILIKSN